MLSVGLLAALLGGRALWLVPPAFISAMTIAGVMGAAGLRTPYVEVGIALSVVFLGLAIALGLSVSVLTAMALVGALPCSTATLMAPRWQMAILGMSM